MCPAEGDIFRLLEVLKKRHVRGYVSRLRLAEHQTPPLENEALVRFHAPFSLSVACLLSLSPRGCCSSLRSLSIRVLQ